MRRHTTPRRCSSDARSNPVGPAPTTRTFASAVIWTVVVSRAERKCKDRAGRVVDQFHDQRRGNGLLTIEDLTRAVPATQSESELVRFLPRGHLWPRGRSGGATRPLNASARAGVAGCAQAPSWPVPFAEALTATRPTTRSKCRSRRRPPATSSRHTARRRRALPHFAIGKHGALPPAPCHHHLLHGRSRLRRNKPIKKPPRTPRAPSGAWRMRRRSPVGESHPDAIESNSPDTVPQPRILGDLGVLGVLGGEVFSLQG